MITFRTLQPQDREPIRKILQETRHFTDPEIDIAIELADAVIDGTDSGYRFVVAVDGPGIIGYGCWGEVPLTTGAWDIYWIAVSPDAQGHGIGTRLLGKMESDIQAEGGRMILLETSSTGIYRNTRAFYEKRGYVIESVIRDFYKPGDDRVIFVKRLEPFG
jgi:ribosomal protein S18 acetylase RimI-like enzyme